MKLTLKENINTESLILKHNILLQASGLITGREGVLQTEKDLYLIMAFVDNLIEEDLIALCNEDIRDLTAVMVEDIEPFFMNLIKEEKYNVLYKEVRELFLQRCKEIWDNQHSVIGMIDAFLTSIATLSDEDKKEALKETAKIAEMAFDRRTEIMEEKVDDVNSKLETFVRNYQEKQQEEKNKIEEEKEESNAE
jgi:hypothetical protein